MPAPRKSKKVLIQFVIAFAVAAILGVVAVVVGFTIISGVTQQAQQAKLAAEKKAAEAEAEKRRLQAAQENQQQAPRTYKVVQANVNLEPGQAITQEMVTLTTTVDRPAAGSLTMLSQAVGKMVKAPIMSGEPLDSSKLLDSGGYVMVKDGMRAISISVDLTGGLNGALFPGSRVDILTSIRQGEQLVTYTLLQNIQIASVGGNTAMPGRAASSEGLPVTVIVTPQQAQKLALASSLGSFHLTLRNFNDKRNVEIPTEDLTALMTGLQSGNGLAKAVQAKPRKASGNAGFHNVNYNPEGTALPNPLDNTPAKSKYSMQIYRGSGAESVDFQQ